VLPARRRQMMGDPSPSSYTNSYVLGTKWSRKSKYRMSEAGPALERVLGTGKTANDSRLMVLFPIVAISVGQGMGDIPTLPDNWRRPTTPCSLLNKGGRFRFQIPLLKSCEKINNLARICQLTDKAQRLAKNNCFVFFAPSTTLPVSRRMKCFGSSRDYFTASHLRGVRGRRSGEHKRKPSLFVVSWEKDAD
jgi:hypothetical protein